jgi:rhodanese-related sulfurtransferase
MLKYLIYLIPLAAFGVLMWRRRPSPATDLKGLLDRGAQIVDVRTQAEFQSAGDPRSLNIPLAELEARLGELDRARPVLVCCATGSRSGLGLSFLKRAGFSEVANLGSWRRIQSLLS